MNTLLPMIACALTLLGLVICHPAQAQGPKTFDVTQAPYNADKTGVNDATTAIQHAVNDAIAYGNANNYPAVTVSLPAGTYLIVNPPINIFNSTNLTFTGVGVASTMIWFTRTDGRVLYAAGNKNFTFENFSADVQKLVATTGLYDLGSTQGTITAINAAANQITVQVETGYPLINRSDIYDAMHHVPTNGYDNTLWLVSDPKRLDFDGNGPKITGMVASPDGKSAVLTVKIIGPRVYVGEQWLIWPNDGGPFANLNNNTGTTTVQNIDFYGGGAVDWMGIADGQTGTLNFNNLYCGTPPYQSDRHMTCNEGWDMNGYNRATINITNSTFLQTYDDVFDVGCAQTSVLSDAVNQVVVQSSDYEVGDTVEFTDDLDAPKGTTYGQSTIHTVTPQEGGNLLLTLTPQPPNQNVTIHNPGKDYMTDLTLAGPITATNCTFNNVSGRHVYFRSGSSVTVQGCTFKDGTPLIIGGLGPDGEGPSEVHNVTVTGSTFLHSDGVYVAANFGASQVASGANVTISGNKFLNCGEYGQRASQPVVVENVTGVRVTNNWFDNNWDANAYFQYDANVTVTGNTFLHPNELPDGYPPGAPVISLNNVAGGTLSGNLLSGAGPFTNALTQIGASVTGVNGLTNGLTQIDNPLAFYLAYDGLVMDQPTSGNILDQAVWTGGKNQKWNALPSQTTQPYAATPSAGLVTLSDSGNGQYVGNGTSLAAGASIVQENQAWQNGSPTQEQLWGLNWIDANTNNLVNDYSGYAINVVSDLSSPGQALCQWYAGNAQNQNFEVVTAPAAAATQQFGLVTVNWTPVPYATSYSIGRATTSGGPYTIIASGLAAGPYTDGNLTRGTTYYYVVTAAGLPVSNSQSNQVSVVPNGNYVTVNLTPAFNVTGIEPDGWNYQGGGYDATGYSYSAALTGSAVTWNGGLFPLGAPAQPNAVSDAGQRIFLPGGSYSSLVTLGSYLGSGPDSNGIFTPTITYSDGSSQALSQGMTNWCGTAGQAGESNAATYAYRNFSTGAKQTFTCYIHGYTIPIDPTRGVAWLDLPSTGNFRLLAMALGANRSTLLPNQYLLPGQYLVSPNGNYILIQQGDGNLVLYNGPDPAHEGASVWASGFYGGNNQCFTILQSDGNLVTYTGTPSNPGSVGWPSGSYNTGVTSLQLTNTPKAQVMAGSTVVWQNP